MFKVERTHGSESHLYNQSFQLRSQNVRLLPTFSFRVPVQIVSTQQAEPSVSSQ